MTSHCLCLREERTVTGLILRIVNFLFYLKVSYNFLYNIQIKIFTQLKIFLTQLNIFYHTAKIFSHSTKNFFLSHNLKFFSLTKFFCQLLTKFCKTNGILMKGFVSMKYFLDF